MTNCRYYFVTSRNDYFKYTRSLEPFKNDNLFKFRNFNTQKFINFLKKLDIQKLKEKFYIL